jgi:hypothetical protein
MQFRRHDSAMRKSLPICAIIALTGHREDVLAELSGTALAMVAILPARPQPQRYVSTRP